MRALLALTFILFVVPFPAVAQTTADPADVASPDAIIEAAYDVIDRAPGENFDWDRMRSLFLPNAVLIPNTEQTGGEHLVLSVEDFIAWADGAVVIGSENDRGFREDQIASRIERYGDIAHVMSTYRKRFYDDDQVLGRGINSFQLVRAHDRWWISAIAWDEEVGAGPIPEVYLP